MAETVLQDWVSDGCLDGSQESDSGVAGVVGVVGVVGLMAAFW